MSNEYFEELAVLRGMMTRAVIRCRDIAESERIMGYKDSFVTYEQMARELSEATLWVSETVPAVTSHLMY